MWKLMCLRLQLMERQGYRQEYINCYKMMTRSADPNGGDKWENLSIHPNVSYYQIITWRKIKQTVMNVKGSRVHFFCNICVMLVGADEKLCGYQVFATASS